MSYHGCYNQSRNAGEERNWLRLLRERDELKAENTSLRKTAEMVGRAEEGINAAIGLIESLRLIIKPQCHETKEEKEWFAEKLEYFRSILADIQKAKEASHE